MGTLKDFQEILNELMSDNELNIERLAKKIKCNRSAIDRWVAGTGYPNVKSLIKVADYAKCSIDYLFALTLQVEFTPQNSSNFLERYNQLLLANDLTDYKVAKLCKIGNSAIAKWRKFNRVPETENLLQLSNIFGCSIEYLIGRC